jgi:hypothetical protein
MKGDRTQAWQGTIGSVSEVIARFGRAFIHPGKSETLELKESFDTKVLETIGAFANAGGGTILVGVPDDGLPPPAVTTMVRNQLRQ